MGSHPLLHPTQQTLSEFSLGKLGDGQVEVINNHLQECPDCQRLVAEMSSDSFLGRLRGAQGQPGAADSGSRGPAMSEEPALQAKAGTLPPDLADHPDYEIVRELGRGGMGVVYLAHNRLMGRDEVLKVVSKHLIERKGVLERFSREIRSAAKLMHPNIVHAYSAFRSGESVVFAMEYVQGLDLAKLVKSKGPMSVAHASYFVHQAALGLQHAHEQGMVHRDIKPGNLMLTRKGDRSIVKVLDFGLAKATRDCPLEGALTHEGQMLGTPDFIAPEQIRDAQSAGIQADIYSLGCTLYYLLTGGPPFEATSLYDLLQAHFSMDAQPLNLVRPEVPAELAALVSKMMAKDVGRRFQTPAEVAEALKPFFKKAGATAKPEVSTLEQSDLSPEKIESVSTVSEPPTKAARQPMKPADSSSIRSESQLSTLGEFKEPERSGDVGAIVTSAGSGGRPRWRSGPVVAAATALGLVVLGVIIVIITKDRQVTIETEKGTTTVAVGKTAGGGDGPSVVAGSTENSRVSPPPSATVTPASTPETVAAAANAGSMSSQATAPRPAPDPVSDKAQGVGAVGAKDSASITNSINMKLVLIPAGEFMMGSPGEEKDALANEKPQHPVRISAFYLGETEVTQEQYLSVMGNNPSIYKYGGSYPVEKVSWTEAALFCNALSEKEGRTPFYPEEGKAKNRTTRGRGYRLPTEAEWEYGCRARKTTRYSFGDDPWIFGMYGWSGGNTHPVREKRPNDFGLYDMHGNVSEWCSDWFGQDYYKHSPESDPTGTTSVGTRVLRGGSWDHSLNDCRSASRDWAAPDKRERFWGFRVALQASEKAANEPGNGKSDIRQPNKLKVDHPTGEAKDAGARPSPSGVNLPPVSTNSIGMKLALIPPGEFMMGSPDSDLWAENSEKPRRRVKIGQPFYLGICEVTQSQYRTVTADFPERNVWFVSGDDIPIYYISWKDTIEFCNALSKREGLTPYYTVNSGLHTVGDGYRLPTEAEWEYACRAGSDSRYYFGDDPTELVSFAWIAGNSESKPHPVGQRRPNAFGLYDMAGNIAEFCGDPFRVDSYADPRPTPTLEQSLTVERVVRGGGFSTQPRVCRSAARGSRPPDFRFSGNFTNFWGFRVARNFRAGDSRGLKPQTAVSAPSAFPVAGPKPTAGDRGADMTRTKDSASSPISGPTQSPVADSPPEGTLKKHGLTKSGSYFVLALETEILEKFEKLKPLIATMAQPFNMFAQALRNDMLVAEAEEYLNDMKVRVDTANTMLSKMPNGGRANSEEKLEYQQAQSIRDDLVQERDNAASVVEARRAQQIPAGRKEELVKDFNAKWSEFVKAADELAPFFDKALREYRKLHDDSSVKEALAEFSRSTKATAILGPSKNLQNALDTIKNARRAYAPETAAPKKKTRPANTPASASPKKKGQATKR